VRAYEGRLILLTGEALSHSLKHVSRPTTPTPRPGEVEEDRPLLQEEEEGGEKGGRREGGGRE